MKASTDGAVRKREIFAWALYDFANSSYSTVIITAVYASFFTEYVVPRGSHLRDSYWSFVGLTSTFLAFLLSPLVGAICDLSGAKKRYLFLTTLACSALTMLLAFIRAGDVWPAILLLTFSNAAYMLSETLCGSFLTDLSTPENVGKISGIGWAIGYFGGLSCLFIAKGLITAPPETQLDLFVLQNGRAAFMTGCFFLVASLPTFIFVRERSCHVEGFESASLPVLFREGLRKFLGTWRMLKSYPTLLQFLKAFLVYTSGLYVIIAFVGIYARGELNFQTRDLVFMFLSVQLTAAAGAFLFGLLESRIGSKPVVLMTLFWWVLDILSIIFLSQLSALSHISEHNLFMGISLIAGAAIGATQSSSRAIVGSLAPPEHAAQIFGCWGAMSRLAGMIAMSFGFLADAISSRKLALFLVVFFFVTGAAMLWRIPLKKYVRV